MLNQRMIITSCADSLLVVVLAFLNRERKTDYGYMLIRNVIASVFPVSFFIHFF